MTKRLILLIAFAIVLSAWANGPRAATDLPTLSSAGTVVPASAADRQVASVLPDMADIEPLLHRLGTNNIIIKSLATTLYLTTDSTWRCREMYRDLRDEPNVLYTFMQGRDSPDDLIFFEDRIDHYTAIHAKTDGSFVTGVAIELKTGKGIRLNWNDARVLLEKQIAVWNEAAR